MSRSTNEIVTEIKTLYGRRHEEKLVIQVDMVTLRDEHGWKEQQISDATGIPQQTVSRWLIAYDESLTHMGRGSRLTPASDHASSDRAVAKRVLRDLPQEAVERVLDELPPEQVQKIAAAAGNSYHKARVEYAESERNLTPAQHKEREAVRSTIEDHATKTNSSFATLGIVGHLEQATDDLRALNEARAVTPELGKQIAAAFRLFEEELEVSLAIAQLERGPGGLIGIEEEA